MKAKAAHKVIRHAKPFKKVVHGKKHAPAAAPNKKEKMPVGAAPTDVMFATFEVPPTYVEVGLEPEIELVEVFETSLPEYEGEGEI